MTIDDLMKAAPNISPEKLAFLKAFASMPAGSNSQAMLRQLTQCQKQAQQENRSNNHFAIVVRADEGIDYGKVVDLLDHFRKAGISRFGLAADAGGK